MKKYLILLAILLVTGCAGLKPKPAVEEVKIGTATEAEGFRLNKVELIGTTILLDFVRPKNIHEMTPFSLIKIPGGVNLGKIEGTDKASLDVGRLSAEIQPKAGDRLYLVGLNSDDKIVRSNIVEIPNPNPTAKAPPTKGSSAKENLPAKEEPAPAVVIGSNKAPEVTKFLWVKGSPKARERELIFAVNPLAFVVYKKGESTPVYAWKQDRSQEGFVGGASSFDEAIEYEMAAVLADKSLSLRSVPFKVTIIDPAAAVPVVRAIEWQEGAATLSKKDVDFTGGVVKGYMVGIGNTVVYIWKADGSKEGFKEEKVKFERGKEYKVIAILEDGTLSQPSAKFTVTFLAAPRPKVDLDTMFAGVSGGSKPPTPPAGTSLTATPAPPAKVDLDELFKQKASKANQKAFFGE